MCDEYAQKYAHIKVLHKTNGGLGFARNSGIAMAEGKYIAFVDSDDAACQQLNREYQKNKNKNEIKSHHYIISFDPRDSTENCLTGKRAQELGLEYAKVNFPGHQALVCTHMDGHNGSGNIHVHIVINSLRKLDVPQQPFMERPIDCKAGYKHHVTNEYLKHLQKSLMDLCRREFLHQVDLLSPSRTGVTETEYWAQRRLDEKKQDIEEKGCCKTGIIRPGTTQNTSIR